MGDDDPQLLVSAHQPLLGTVVELRIDGTPAAARTADASIVAEIRRLEHVFSVFDETSELSRWRRGATDELSAELATLLGTALQWQQLGDGAFNPAAGALSRLWAEASDRGVEPADEQVRSVAAAIATPAYAVDGAGFARVGDCTTLNFNAIAKGFIVDLAAAVGIAVDGVESVVVNAGGDLVHLGSGALAVGIENPLTPYDNAPPLTIIDVARCAVATSGSARRGLRIDGRWFSHVIDPRSGRPVDHIRSASVIAPDACTADAVATVVGVMHPRQGIAFVDALDGVSCCLVDGDGVPWRSTEWHRYERPR